MEVVSPPLFGRVNQGAKRRFGSPTANCSTSAVATASNNTADDFDMMDDCSSSYGFQATKRRKRFSNDGGVGGGGENNNNFTFHQSKENWSLSPFVQATSRSPLHGGGGGGAGKLFLCCNVAIILTTSSFSFALLLRAKPYFIAINL